MPISILLSKPSCPHFPGGTKENAFVQKHMTCLVPLEDIPI